MTRIGVIGLGQAGLPLATTFADEGFVVTGYDVAEEKIAALRNGEHRLDHRVDTRDVEISFSTTPDSLSKCDVIFVVVPTPITPDGEPDMSPLQQAGRTIGHHLSRDTIVVLKSTVYPGGTRAELVPEIEKTSGWTAGAEFTIGYAPERMNPGDEAHTLRKVSKVVAAPDTTSRGTLVDLFETITEAPVYPISSIEACEAAKCLENVQRDVNIALINEFVMGCEQFEDVDPYEVLEAATTKWNFHSYQPGLVNGHCIPIDPYYLIHCFEDAGYSPALMKTARTVNDQVGTYVADILCNALEERRRLTNPVMDGGGVTSPLADETQHRVLLTGLTYKPNVADIRAPTTKLVIGELLERGLDVVGYDPHTAPAATEAEFGIPVQEAFCPTGFDALIVNTGHESLRDLDFEWVASEMTDQPVLVDTTGTLEAATARKQEFIYRRL